MTEVFELGFTSQNCIGHIERLEIIHLHFNHMLELQLQIQLQIAVKILALAFAFIPTASALILATVFALTST